MECSNHVHIRPMYINLFSSISHKGAIDVCMWDLFASGVHCPWAIGGDVDYIGLYAYLNCIILMVTAPPFIVKNSLLDLPIK